MPSFRTRTPSTEARRMLNHSVRSGSNDRSASIDRSLGDPSPMGEPSMGAIGFGGPGKTLAEKITKGVKVPGAGSGGVPPAIGLSKIEQPRPYLVRVHARENAIRRKNMPLLAERPGMFNAPPPVLDRDALLASSSSAASSSRGGGGGTPGGGIGGILGGQFPRAGTPTPSGSGTGGQRSSGTGPSAKTRGVIGGTASGTIGGIRGCSASRENSASSNRGGTGGGSSARRQIRGGHQQFPKSSSSLRQNSSSKLSRAFDSGSSASSSSSGNTPGYRSGARSPLLRGAAAPAFGRGIPDHGVGSSSSSSSSSRGRLPSRTNSSTGFKRGVSPAVGGSGRSSSNHREITLSTNIKTPGIGATSTTGSSTRLGIIRNPSNSNIGGRTASASRPRRHSFTEGDENEIMQPKNGSGVGGKGMRASSSRNALLSEEPPRPGSGLLGVALGSNGGAVSVTSSLDGPGSRLRDSREKEFNNLNHNQNVGYNNVNRSGGGGEMPSGPPIGVESDIAADDAKLKIYQESYRIISFPPQIKDLFDEVITRDNRFGPLLAKIKSAYDEAIITATEAAETSSAGESDVDGKSSFFTSTPAMIHSDMKMVDDECIALERRIAAVKREMMNIDSQKDKIDEQMEVLAAGRNKGGSSSTGGGGDEGDVDMKD